MSITSAITPCLFLPAPPSALDTSTHLGELGDKRNAYNSSLYVDWAGESFWLPEEMRVAPYVGWHEQDVMAYGKMGSQEERDGRQAEMQEILDRLSSEEKLSVIQGDSQTSFKTSPLLTHSSTLRRDEPMSPVPCLSPTSELDHRRRRTCSPTTPGPIHPPPLEDLLPVIAESESHDEVPVIVEAAPDIAKSAPATSGDLDSLAMLYASSAFADSDVEDDGQPCISPRHTSVRHIGREEILTAAFTMKGRLARPIPVRAHSEPPTTSSYSLLARPRSASLPPGVKAPFLYRSLGPAAFEQGSRQTRPSRRQDSPEVTLAQALAHRLGQTGTSHMRTMVGEDTVPSSPTTHDTWDTETDDLPTLEFDETPRKVQREMGMATQMVDVATKDDKQAVLDSIASAEAPLVVEQSSPPGDQAWTPTPTPAAAQSLKRKTPTNTTGNAASQSKRVTPAARRSAGSEDVALPLKRGYAYVPDVPAPAVEDCKRPLNKYIRDKGWEAIPVPRRRRSATTAPPREEDTTSIMALPAKASRSSPAAPSAPTVPALKRRHESPPDEEYIPPVKKRMMRSKTTLSRTEESDDPLLLVEARGSSDDVSSTPSSNRGNRHRWWLPEEDKIALSAWSSDQRLAPQLEFIRQCLGDAGYERTTGAIKWQLTHRLRDKHITTTAKASTPDSGQDQGIEAAEPPADNEEA